MKEKKWEHKLFYIESVLCSNKDVNELLEEYLNENNIEDFKIISADGTFINIIYKL